MEFRLFVSYLGLFFNHKITQQAKRKKELSFIQFTNVVWSVKIDGNGPFFLSWTVAALYLQIALKSTEFMKFLYKAN
jgi:hypothetical protein